MIIIMIIIMISRNANPETTKNEIKTTNTQSGIRV